MTNTKRGRYEASRRKRGIVRRVLVGSLMLVASGAFAADLELPVLWQVDLKTKQENASTAADIDGDGAEEVIIATLEEVVILSGRGETLVRWPAPARIMSYPGLLERPGQPPLIFVGDSSGCLTCLDGLGNEVWQKKMAVIGESAAVVCDLDGDGAIEVVQSDATGKVWVLDALTGEVRREAKVEGHAVSPSLGDLDGDGLPELVISSGNGIVYAMDGDGTILWQHQIGGTSLSWSTSAAVIFATAQGEPRVMAASADGKVYCFDATGNVLWQRPVQGPVASGISVGDMDLDGCADIFVVTQLGVIYRFDESGRVMWEIDMKSRSLAAGAIVDVDGDGSLEYVLCSQGGYFIVLNQAGEFIYEHRYEWRTINMTPTFAEISKDSPGLEMIVTCDNGDVICYATKAPAGPGEPGVPGQWMMYRADRRKTGAWFGLSERTGLAMSPTNLAWDAILTGEPVRFVVDNPNPPVPPSKETALSAGAECVTPDGSRLTARTSVIGGHGELLLPLDVLVPGTYRFSWWVKAPDGREMFSGAREVPLRPFVNDRALVARALEILGETAARIEPILPLSASALRREASALESRSNAAVPLETAAPGGSAQTERKALDAVAETVADARRALGVCTVVEKAAALGSGTSIVAFQGALWNNRGVDEQLPAEAFNPLRIERKVVPGECDSVSVSLFNITDRELNVQVLVESEEGGPSAIVRRPVSVPTSLGERSWDPLPELDDSSVVTIPSLSSREVWFEVHIGEAAPGPHALTVRLLALDGAGVLAPRNAQPMPAPETRVEMAIDVLPFQMAPSGSYRLCTWADPDPRYIGDLLAHGNNVFIVPHGEPAYDAQGNLQRVDYSKLDEILNTLEGADVMLLIHGSPDVQCAEEDPSYLARMKAYVDDMQAHLAGRGVDIEHFALYAKDEPGGHGMEAVDYVVAFAKVIRAVNPSIMLYVNGGGSGPMFEKMGPYTDIWCPGIYALCQQDQMMQVIRSTGKMIWTYNCGYSHARPIGPNIKNINIIAEYRIAPLFVLSYGGSGGGYWCYNKGEDMWTRIKNEYRLVYEGRTQPIPARRWEAVREGIEDYRILVALRDRLDAADSVPLSADLQARIRHLLGARMRALVDEGRVAMGMGLSARELDLIYGEDLTKAFRDEMMACVEGVCAESGR